MGFVYEFPRPAVTVDAVVFALGERGLEVVLIRRKRSPFAGRWALPGGFVDQDEALDAAARRELMEETGLSAPILRQVGAYGDPGRDPRGHTVGVAFLTAARRGQIERKLRAGDDAGDARLWPADRLPALAFDHDRIFREALGMFSRLAGEEGLLFRLLPRVFGVSELAAALRAIGRPADSIPKLRRELRRASFLERAMRRGGEEGWVFRAARFRELRGAAKPGWTW